MSMQAILSASQSMSKMQAMQSANVKMQGQANVLRIESKLDGGSADKEEKIKDLEEKANNLVGNLMNEASDVNETLSSEEATKPETDVSEASKEDKVKEPKTDKLELSYSKTDKDEETSLPVKIATGEPVTYKADGSTVSDVLTPFQVFGNFSQETVDTNF